MHGIDGPQASEDATAMAVVKARPLTKFDYWQLPETGPRYQLINGDLYMAPAPNRFHQDISRTIQFEILKYLEREPGGSSTMRLLMWFSPI
jgi:Uma2 family endonuclease